MKEKMIVNREAYVGDQDDYDVIKEAVKKLSAASQEQFESIKKEKWYNRVFDMVTFSQKGKKRIAEQVGTLAQAQQILIELLLRLSENDANISKIVLDSMEDIAKIQEQNIYLLSRIKRLENVTLGIKKDMDLSSLTDFEKEVLCACLYFVSDKNGQTSEEQKIYANAVISYIDVDVQMDNPVAALGEMNADSRKRILNCCMEYMFLKDCSDRNYEEYKEFISEFDFGDKSIKAIEKQIRALYNLRGCEGFYTKYQPDNFGEIEDAFFLDFEEEEDAGEEAERTDETISSILRIESSEVKKYCNKNIHLNAYINCEGELHFNHCTIYYNESEAGDEITLAENAKLFITNSVVICKGYDENAFITCKWKNEVLIENTSFEDCSYFIGGSNISRFSVVKCQVHNCFKEFISIYLREDSICEIKNNIIIQDDLKQFYIGKAGWNPKFIKITSYGDEEVLFCENVICEEEGFRRAGLQDGDEKDNKLRYFDCDNAIVKNCTFVGISSAVEAHSFLDSKFENCKAAIELGGHNGNTSVDNCVFINCTNVIRTADNSKITNCQFVSCYDSIISPGTYESGVTVSFCQFVNIKNSLKNNFWGADSSITFVRWTNSQAMENYLKKCIFDGVELEDNFLIAAEERGKPNGVVTYIKECDFRNCSTKRADGKIIKEYIKYDTFFKKKQDFHANQISDCRGLDRINKEKAEADNVEIKTKSTTGNNIGAVVLAGGSPVLAGIAAGVSAIHNIIDSNNE
ncbi:MAG: right-handed parallel beta-helix repeat-containing protein [Eubacterium sp.]|nr:right-handed parallel beta-helix repeat-containing protein [Eubacterium sp.]